MVIEVVVEGEVAGLAVTKVVATKAMKTKAYLKAAIWIRRGCFQMAKSQVAWRTREMRGVLVPFLGME